jgi:tartrate dehydratase alpha subunit/fumarate hydratase class I-like protein
VWVYALRTNVHLTLKQNPLRRSELAEVIAREIVEDVTAALVEFEAVATTLEAQLAPSQPSS